MRTTRERVEGDEHEPKLTAATRGAATSNASRSIGWLLRWPRRVVMRDNRGQGDRIGVNGGHGGHACRRGACARDGGRVQDSVDRAPATCVVLDTAQVPTKTSVDLAHLAPLVVGGEH